MTGAGVGPGDHRAAARPTYADFQPLAAPVFSQQPTYVPPKRTGGFADVLVVTGLIGLGVGAGVYAGRAPAGRAIILGLTAAVALFVLLRLSTDVAGQSISRWRPPIVTPSLRALARRWQFARYDRLTGPAPALVSDVRERMRSVLGAELERRGIDWDSGQARAALGAGVHELLSGPVDGKVTSRQLHEIMNAAAAICPPTARYSSGPDRARGQKGRTS